MSSDWKKLGEHYMESETGQLYEVETVDGDRYKGYAMDWGLVNEEGLTILDGPDRKQIKRFREIDKSTKDTKPVVYGIHIGNIQEGGGLENHIIYKDFEKAEQRAKEILKEEKDRQEEIYSKQELDSQGLPYRWERKTKNKWSNGIDQILILDLKLIT